MIKIELKDGVRAQITRELISGSLHLAMRIDSLPEVGPPYILEGYFQLKDFNDWVSKADETTLSLKPSYEVWYV